MMGKLPLYCDAVLKQQFQYMPLKCDLKYDEMRS